MYNKSLKGALENSNGLQNTDEPVKIIKKKKKKKLGEKGCKNSLHSTFMHLWSCQVELCYPGVPYES